AFQDRGHAHSSSVQGGVEGVGEHLVLLEHDLAHASRPPGTRPRRKVDGAGPGRGRAGLDRQARGGGWPARGFAGAAGGGAFGRALLKNSTPTSSPRRLPGSSSS